MDMQKLIFTIFQQFSPQARQEKIRQMSKQIISQLYHLDQLEKQQNLKQQQHLFQAFFKVVEKISAQLKQAKKKYQDIDRQKLKQDKCIALSHDINVFRQQCFYLRNKVNQSKKQLRNIKMQNQLLEQQQNYMQVVNQRKSQQKQKLKMRKSAILWGATNQDKSVSKQHTNRKTFISLNLDRSSQKPKSRKQYLYLYKNSKQQKNRAEIKKGNTQNIYKRLLATSQQPRRMAVEKQSVNNEKKILVHKLRKSNQYLSNKRNATTFIFDQFF